MRKLLVIAVATLLLLCGCNKSENILHNDTANDDKRTNCDTVSKDMTYVVNKSSLVYHSPDCYLAENISDENKAYTADKDFLKSRGYRPCSQCIENE